MFLRCPMILLQRLQKHRLSGERPWLPRNLRRQTERLPPKQLQSNCKRKPSWLPKPLQQQILRRRPPMPLVRKPMSKLHRLVMKVNHSNKTHQDNRALRCFL